MMAEEREIRDVLEGLTGCVAMRYAAEKNLQYIAEMERRQRAVWEREFSSCCAHPVVILLPDEVSGCRARGVDNSNSNNNNRLTVDKNDKGGGGGDSHVKCMMITSEARTSDDAVNSDGQVCQHLKTQQQLPHQQRPYHANQGELEERGQKKARAHSLGSAKFLFHHALEHHKSGPIVLENTYDDTNDSGITRWGSERAVRKGSFSPFKLADDGTPQEQHYDDELDDEIVVGSIAPTSTSSPRVCTNMTRAARAAADNNNKRTAPREPVHREPLRRSTWLGPDLMPLQNYQDAARINSQRPDIIKFAAAAWPTPKQNGRRGGANRGVHGYRGADRGGSNGSSSNESDVAREVRRQRMRGSFQRNAACSICGTGTNSGRFSNAQH
ncbi:unnamed protein product, partial [Ectocarpus sp. 8 AP-2014]